MLSETFPKEAPKKEEEKALDLDNFTSEPKNEEEMVQEPGIDDDLHLGKLFREFFMSYFLPSTFQTRTTTSSAKSTWTRTCPPSIFLRPLWTLLFQCVLFLFTPFYHQVSKRTFSPSSKSQFAKSLFQQTSLKRR